MLPGSRLSGLRADVVFAWRQLTHRKLTAAAAVLSLALAMGACTAAFQLMDALLWRPLPVAHAERLYGLSRQGILLYGKPASTDAWPYPLFRRMRDAVADQAALVAVSFAERAELTFRSEQEMEKAVVQYVSGDLFAGFELRPALGRLLGPGDDRTPGGHPVAVLSHDYWTRRFGADPQALGRTFRLGDRLYQVIGVAPPGFTGTEPGTVVDIFMPAMMHWGIAEPNWLLFRVLAELREGAPAGPVRERLGAVLAAYLRERPQPLPQTLVMTPAAAGVSTMQSNYRLPSTILGVLVGLVLLIACVNVANLKLAQTAARAREMAVRVSLGAGRGRLARMIFAESGLLAVAAAAAGAAFAAWAAPEVAGRINPADRAARLALQAGWRGAAFGLALTLAVTLLCGLAPALRAGRVPPAAALKDGPDPRSRGRLMHGLIAVQAAFCFLVLVVAGLFVNSFARLSGQPVGFPTARLLNLDIVNPTNEPAALWDQVAARLRATPGVEAVAYADWPLLDGYSFKINAVSLDGAAPGDVDAWFLNVSPGWLATLRIPLRAGRDFRPSDLSPGAAIVNQAFARQYFGGRNPIGQWFAGTSGYMRGQRFQIVGVVGDARYRYLREDVVPVAYTPFHRLDNKGTMKGGTFVVRTAAADPLALAATLRGEVARARPEFRVREVRSQDQLLGAQTVRERLLALLALFFAVVAVLLAGVGLYGVLEFAVSRRRREIGIRLAIGAPPAEIARRIAFDTFGILAAGALAGAALGLASGRYIGTLLYQVQAGDWRALVVPSLALFIVALLAALPALVHALRTDPAAVLRAE